MAKVLEPREEQRHGLGDLKVPTQPRLDFGEEIRIEDPITGGQKGSKLARIGLIPVYAQVEEAKVYGMGAKKYAPNNWRRGYDWSLSYDAMQRHLLAWWYGEELDEQSQLSHLAHARWHTGVLLEFSHFELGTDDRAFRVDPNEE